MSNFSANSFNLPRFRVDINQFPKRNFTSPRNSNQNECSICLESFDPPTGIVRILPCTHNFHHKCLAVWVKTNRTCPMCRFQLPVSLAFGISWNYQHYRVASNMNRAPNISPQTEMTAMSMNSIAARTIMQRLESMRLRTFNSLMDRNTQ